MGLLSMFKKAVSGAANDASTKLARRENKEVVEAVVYGCIMMAHADGTLGDDELANISLQLENNEIFNGFPPAELGAMIEKACSLYKMGKLMGDTKCMNQIKDVKKDPKNAEEVLVAVLTVAFADGDFSATERACAEKISLALGLRLKDYAE
jgi:tellurite resistance protein TerB